MVASLRLGEKELGVFPAADLAVGICMLEAVSIVRERCEIRPYTQY